MHDVHLAGIDLNLLVALDALLAERNVTRAAARVGITQPAMSHALARLRELLDDPLLVRTPRGMLPTARAERLEAPIRQALGAIDRALHEPPKFEPAAARRTFAIATSDYGELVLLPKLLARLSREAPNVDLRVVTLPEEWTRRLEEGALDLVVAPSVTTGGAGVRTQKLFDDGFVCVVREGHPIARRGLTLERYLELPHALTAPGGRSGGIVDDVLAAKGLRRRVALVVPHFLVAPIAVAHSDLVLTLAERVARSFASLLPLRILDPPLDLPRFSMRQSWHERRQNDPAHAWLRGLLADVANEGVRRRTR